MGEVTQKVWGWSEAQVVGPICEIHRIDVHAGGYCSWHQHDRKHNAFTVIRGVLVVEYDGGVKGDDGYPRRPHTLVAGDTVDVPPGVVHRFRCPQATQAIEVYWPVSLDPADIHRFSQGGIDS